MRAVVPRGMKCFFFVEAMLPVLESLTDMMDWFSFFCVKQERVVYFKRK
jgi:hypothetical protein